KRLAGRAEDHHFVCTGRQCAVESAHVGREHGIDGAGTALYCGHDLRRVRHLRDPLRRHEGRGLDVGETRCCEPVDKLDLDVGGDEFFLVLQAVSGGYLDDLHFLRCGHVVSSRLAVNDTLLAPDIATVIQALNDLVKLQFCEHGGHPRECQTTAATQL